MIRAMRLGRRPAQGTVLRATSEVHLSKDISANATYMYDGPSYRGYVIRIENVSDSTRRLDPSRFAGRDLVLAGAREMVLDPGAKTLLYLVFWKRP